MATEPQSTEKPPSMRQLTEQVAEGVAALVDDANRRNSAQATVSGPPPITEAVALARCLDALDELKAVEDRRNTNQGNYSYSTQRQASWGSTERILRYLAARFDVSLIEVRRPDCDRAHLDAISPDAFVSALRMSADVTR